MDLRGLLPLAAALGLLAPSARAQSTNSCRHFTALDGLAETACLSVTLGGGGDVLIRHPHTNAVSIFGGYEFIIIPGPDEPQRVYQSPSGQLWTVAPEGLREFRDGEWNLVPLAPIAAHFRAGRTNEIILLPVRQGRVLVLLPEELLQFIAESPDGPRVEPLLRAAETSLGTFTRFATTRSGSLCVSGTTGFAKSRQSFRSLAPGGGWEFTTEKPVDYGAENSTSASAEWQATAAGLIRCTAMIWELFPSSSSRTEAQTELRTLNPEAQNNPVQLSAADRAVIEAAGPLANWHTSFKARNGDLWLGSENKIAWARGETLQLFSSTNQVGPEQVFAFAESPDGRIVCATPAKLWEFDGRNWLALRSGFNHVNSLRYARNGTLWVAANDGVHRLARGAWVRNNAADGLPAGGVTNLEETATGEIIAHCATGDWRFNPAADIEPPRAFIPPLPDSRAQIHEGDALRLGFTGRDRWNVTTPERLIFSYKLDEREWSSFEEISEALFADLPAGRHLFQVRAMDRNANISAQSATLEFTVVLPWYRETRLVFILAIALIVALALAGLAYNRHRKLQVSYASVERQVAERTRELELAQRELLHGQKMNALGTLSAGIAHDFNNILSIIKGSAQIIEDNPGHEEKIRTRVDRIKTVVQQGAGIVEAMLGFSRQSPDQAAPADVNMIVEDTLKLLGDRFLRGMEVKFERGDGLPDVSVARDFVQQVLLNFIFNAAEAMERHQPPGQTRNQVTIRTSAATALPPGLFLKPAAAASFIQISVTDTGGGITPENLPRIFEPFFTTKAMSSQRGTGLGLTMVYELARKLEAGLAVESQPGAGSTFTLILPIKRT